jgi:hypothetical protein
MLGEQPWPRHPIAGVERSYEAFAALDAFNPIAGYSCL